MFHFVWLLTEQIGHVLAPQKIAVIGYFSVSVTGGWIQHPLVQSMVACVVAGDRRGFSRPTLAYEFIIFEFVVFRWLNTLVVLSCDADTTLLYSNLRLPGAACCRERSPPDQEAFTHALAAWLTIG